MRSKAESLGLDQSLGWSALSVRSDLDKFGYWRGDSSFFWDIHPGHRFPFPTGNVPRCLIYRPGVPHTLLLMKELTAQEMKCGNEQTLLEFTVPSFPRPPWSSWPETTVQWALETWESVSSGGKYLAGLGCCSSGGCTNSKGASPEDTVVKNPFGNAGDTSDRGSIPGLGRSPGGRNGKLIQYSCLRKFRRQRKGCFLCPHLPFQWYLPLFIHSLVKRLYPLSPFSSLKHKGVPLSFLFSLLFWWHRILNPHSHLALGFIVCATVKIPTASFLLLSSTLCPR